MVELTGDVSKQVEDYLKKKIIIAHIFKSKIVPLNQELLTNYSDPLSKKK